MVSPADEEAGGEHTDASNERGTPVPANPDGCEPGGASEQGKIAGTFQGSQEIGHETGQEERKSRRQCEGCGEGRAPGVRGDSPGTFGDGKRTQPNTNGGQPGGKTHQPLLLHGHGHHCVIVACDRTPLASVLATVQTEGSHNAPYDADS